MVFEFWVGNKTTGEAVTVQEGGSQKGITVHDGDIIDFNVNGANVGKLVDLQRSPNGTTWTNWQSIRAGVDGRVDFMDWTEPTPAPGTEYYRAISRTV